ncbi:MAG: hypothetical protein R3F39_01865 [Myxococcota bacterium]
MRRSICKSGIAAALLLAGACGGGGGPIDSDANLFDAADADQRDGDAADGDRPDLSPLDLDVEADTSPEASDLISPPEIAPDTDVDAGPLELLEDRQGFRSVARVRLDSSGVSERFDVGIAPASAAVYLRVSARDAVARCFQLDEAVTSEGESWVELASEHSDYGVVCRHCTQRVSVGQGFGLFQLPNDGRASVGTASLSLRVAERDCATSLPLSIAPGALRAADSVDVEVLEAADLGRAASQVLRLPVRFLVSDKSQFEAGAAGVDAILDEAFGLVRAAFEAQGIRPDFQEILSAEPGFDDPLVYGTDDVSALSALLDASVGPPDDALGGLSPLTVVVAGCLRRHEPSTGALRDPQAVTTHVCAGLGPPGVGDGVVLAGHACPSVPPAGYWSGATLGTILAHELGHALGLYHVADSGDATDNLEDTDAANLMNADPLGHLNDGFSPLQGRVMRSHPLLRPLPARFP